MAKPVFLYDGECPFCRLWAGRWERSVGGAVEFRTFPEGKKRSSSEFVDRDRTYLGAEGVFRMLAAGDRGSLLWCYRRVPLFAPASEIVYRAVSSCRVCAYKMTKWMFRTRNSPSRFL